MDPRLSGPRPKPMVFMILKLCIKWNLSGFNQSPLKKYYFTYPDYFTYPGLFHLSGTLGTCRDRRCPDNGMVYCTTVMLYVHSSQTSHTIASYDQRGCQAKIIANCVTSVMVRGVWITRNSHTQLIIKSGYTHQSNS